MWTILKNYLVLAELGFCCCMWTFSSCLEQGLLSSCGEQGLLPGCGAWVSHCGGFSCCRAQALDPWAQ